jgi:hypothetical protein
MTTQRWWVVLVLALAVQGALAVAPPALPRPLNAQEHKVVAK